MYKKGLDSILVNGKMCSEYMQTYGRLSGPTTYLAWGKGRGAGGGGRLEGVDEM